MMSRKSVLGVLLLVVCGLFSATPLFAKKLKVTVQRDPYAVFYPAKTYGWHPLSAVYYNFDAPIRAIIERELATRGFQRATSGAPDFWVGYQFHRVEGEKIVRNNISKGDYYWNSEEYRAGTMTLDIFSPDQRRIIFKGISESVYDPSASDAEKIRLTDEAVKKIVAQLPPAS